MILQDTPSFVHKYLIVSRLFITLFLCIILVSCNTDDFNDLSNATLVQEGAFAFPIGKLDFTLADILENDTTLTIDNDNAIRLVYREDDLFRLEAADILDDLTGELNEVFVENSKIGNVEIDDASQESDVLFSSILDDFNDQALANYISQNNGSLAAIPAFEENILSEEDLPAFNDYTSLGIENGAMFLSITNNFFFDIEGFSIEIIDIGNNQTVGTFSFAYLAMGATETSQIDLSGKDISNEFKVLMSSIKTPGTGASQVIVDLDSKLHIVFEVKNISINQGVVNLPAGILAEDKLIFDFTTDNGERIKSIVLDDAAVTYEIMSEVATDILVKLTFPDITRNNVPVEQELLVTPTSTTSPVTGSFDFSNTVWRLDNDDDQPYNRIRANYEVLLPNGSNGQLAFSSEDEVSIMFSLSQLEVSEVTGFFGFRQEQLDESTYDLGFDFSLFSNGSSPILFSEPEMRIEISNSFGIPLQGEFNATAFGFFGDEANLDPPKVIINYPAMTEMGQIRETDFVLNKVNSNLVELLSVFPSYIVYSGSTTINPNNEPDEVNFITSNSALSASVEFDLPFKFQAQHLIYRDTGQSVDLELDEGGFTIEDIDSAELKIVYDNGLPLKSNIRIITLDVAGNETLVVDNIEFSAASVDADGKVPANGSIKEETFIQLTTEQIEALDDAHQYIYEIIFQTEDNEQVPVAMYSDYRVEVGIGIKMTLSKN